MKALRDIDPQTALLLSAVARGQSIRDAAATAGMPYETARSDLERLKDIAHVRGLDSLRAWWLRTGAVWGADNVRIFLYAAHLSAAGPDSASLVPLIGMINELRGPG